MFNKNNNFKPFDKKVWLASPTTGLLYTSDAADE